MPNHGRLSVPHLLAVCCALILAWSGPAVATPGQIHEVKRPEVNLRAGPGTDAKVIGSLEQGARVMEFAREGRWFRVKQMGRVGPEGWVHGALIAPEKLLEPESPAPPGSTRPPADERGTGGSSDDDGRRYYGDPGGGFRDVLRDRAFLPWGVTVKRKGHGGKRHGDRGRKRHRHGGKAAKGGAVRPGVRNLGWPRQSGAPNIGTF